ncbi:MAG: hypothetical protein M0R34_07335 [Candidatus Marinimicrobia bacterium]|jgi:antitoxin component of MazEF toxin-antitoxin module|nr:hypothetical protein [Candidatus Neomarinimicrobiota bacterium]MCK9484160.1 hypothetical protein [Candidatus Neomarinimicrobiota bacterium]MCK9559659.1 hypothetical protein [Candidatus Neomarinimicrobiota bacterium]MDD5062295.1 hypothetical protein [Candidatus Neomarinimicrobiota bacterium]MDD5229776.1 hypothetical protein [Candidatus Neomarinimicrobiota bacterium]
MRRKIIRVGSSKGVLLPREVTKAMNWEFGTEVELTIDEEKRDIMLKTLKVNVPMEYEIDDLRQIEEVMEDYADLLEGTDD